MIVYGSSSESRYGYENSMPGKNRKSFASTRVFKFRLTPWFIFYKFHKITLMAGPKPLSFYTFASMRNKIHTLLILFIFVCGSCGTDKSPTDRQDNPAVNDSLPDPLMSVLTCPYCGFKKEEAMPVDQCLIFYDCPSCKKKISPKEGDCCVFCSHGSAKCPSMQKEN
jgi:hypothetical protein